MPTFSIFLCSVVANATLVCTDIPMPAGASFEDCAKGAVIDATMSAEASGINAFAICHEVPVEQK